MNDGGRTRTWLFACTLLCAASSWCQNAAAQQDGTPARPQGPCDLYAAAGDPCAAAHSTTRALYAGYRGPLYQVLRQSDGATLDIGVVQPTASPHPDAGGYADAAAQDRFCHNTYCWITTIYDQSPQHNDLTQAPRGGFSGPALGGTNNLPLADMAPVTVMGHRVYGVFIEPGMGLRIDDPKGTAVDDQAEGQYWVINGLHFNSGCCFDYGNAEIDSRDDDNGTMETAYFGDAIPWFHGTPPGPWIMTDQENNLVGCVNPDGSKLCADLPSIKWRFVTAMAKGEPHHWTSLGGNAQSGALSVMFDGPRINSSYDPMRKQGAILLGNGGDNSNGSQGTFYEGAVTSAGTFPTDATDQQIQANVVAAGYAVARLQAGPAASPEKPVGALTFAPGQTRQMAVSFTNVSASPVSGVRLSLTAPDPQWHVAVQGSTDRAKTYSTPVAPGQTVNAVFSVTAGPKAFNGDFVANATWPGQGSSPENETAVVKVRNAVPVRINEFRISSGPAVNMTDSFIELYNASSGPVDLSNWSLDVHAAQQPGSAPIVIPPGTKLAARGFFLLGLANSGLVVPAPSGAIRLQVRSTAGMSVGDQLTIGSGRGAELRKIAALGTAAPNHTTLWQPLPDGPIHLPAGATNVPVESVDGFKVGEGISLGYGEVAPFVNRSTEQYETATVTAVGKPGTQAYLAVDASPGATRLQVTSVEDISAGDSIRLDIDSMGHGIETVTVKDVGSRAIRTNLAADVAAGATSIRVRRAEGFATGNQILVGTPASKETATVASVSGNGRSGAQITLTQGLTHPHGRDEWVVLPGTGLELAAPLRFQHAANLPLSDRGTGITFTPATRFAHGSDDPVQALGSGITLDQPLRMAHPVHEVVHDAAVTTAGYQSQPAPNLWFGGPELSTRYLLFGRPTTIEEGSLVLRDPSGVVVDSVNYGALVDPWAAEGYQGVSGAGHGGCFVPSSDLGASFGTEPSAAAPNQSAGRYPDGADTDSNCEDFHTQAVTVLPMGASAGSSTLQVASVTGFHPGQKLTVGTAANAESATVKSVGTAGATRTSTATDAGTAELPVASLAGFEPGQTITVGQGSAGESVTIVALHRFPGAYIALSSPLQHAHDAGSPVAGSGLALSSALSRQHAPGAQVTDSTPTPGAPNVFGTMAVGPAEP